VIALIILSSITPRLEACISISHKIAYIHLQPSHMGLVETPEHVERLSKSHLYGRGKSN